MNGSPFHSEAQLASGFGITTLLTLVSNVRFSVANLGGWYLYDQV
jgi:hypothetical protein